MTIKDFFTKYNGVGVDFDNYYGFQCVDLYRQYCKEVLQVEQSPGVTGAYQIWTTYIKEDFTQIKNTPEGVPELGDVVIWDKTASLGYGHVAIFNYGDVNSFLSFDQNFPTGSICHFQNHNYTGVLGWLRPKGFDFAQLQITDQTKIDLGTDWGVLEVQAIRSKLSDQTRTIDALNTEFAVKEANWQSELESAKKEIERLVLLKAENLTYKELFSIAFKKLWASRR